MARYEQRDGEGKFWEITIKGRVLSTRAGKLGAGAAKDRDGNLQIYDRRGRTTDRELPDVAAARAEYESLVAAKLRQGFVLVEGGNDADEIVAVQLPTNAELEAAIDADPDGDDAYLVYADWLIDQGDLRGELITTQHAMRGLKDPVAFMRFKKREEELRTLHLRTWLGPVGGAALHRLRLHWHLGFLHGIRVDGFENRTETPLAELVAAVLSSPLARFVRELTIRGTNQQLGAAIPALPPRHLVRLAVHHGVGTMVQLAEELAPYRQRGIPVDREFYDPEIVEARRYRPSGE